MKSLGTRFAKDLDALMRYAAPSAIIKITAQEIMDMIQPGTFGELYVGLRELLQISMGSAALAVWAEYMKPLLGAWKSSSSSSLTMAMLGLKPAAKE